MALTLIKGITNPSQEVRSKNESCEKLFIVQVINKENKLGYLCDIDNKACICDTIIPEVVKFDDYQKAKETANAIKGHGIKTKIIGEVTIEKILEKQGIREKEIIPISAVDKKIYHVLVVDKKTEQSIGHVSFKSNEFSIVKGKDGAAFWDSEAKVEGFIKQLNEQIPEGLKLIKHLIN